MATGWSRSARASSQASPLCALWWLLVLLPAVAGAAMLHPRHCCWSRRRASSAPLPCTACCCSGDALQRSGGACGPRAPRLGHRRRRRPRPADRRHARGGGVPPLLRLPCRNPHRAPPAAGAAAAWGGAGQEAVCRHQRQRRQLLCRQVGRRRGCAGPAGRTAAASASSISGQGAGAVFHTLAPSCAICRYFGSTAAAEKKLPFEAGFEAVGVVAAAAPDVQGIAVGQPVCTMTYGGFAGEPPA